MPYANVNDITLYYELHGEHGSPLVMIPGAGGTIAGWLPEMIASFSTKHRVLIFDNRGSGRSEYPASPFSMAQLAADTVGLLDFLQIDQAHILGPSMGGMIAQHIAIRYPARVLSLVLGCTAAGGPTHPQIVAPAAAVMAQLAKPAAGDRAQAIREDWALSYPPTFLATQPAVLERLLQAKLAYPATSAAAKQQQFDVILHGHDTFAQLPQLACPTLLLTGTEDILIPPENVRILAALIPHARLIEYAGCGHGFWEQCPDNAAQDILAFLAEVDEASRASL